MHHFNGPLRRCAKNPRYFTNDSGGAIYLTGSHTWHSLKDLGTPESPEPFDYGAYLDLMSQHGHNFMRMWTWELCRFSIDGQSGWCAPHPWARVGPGEALDGKPRFDLTRFDPGYFELLRARVEAAAERGIYVSVMLFEGWGLRFTEAPWCRDGHPFCRDNNINDIDGDQRDTGRMFGIQTLEDPEVTGVQEAYVRKVVGTVNDLDNVLFEIANESGRHSIDWQYHFIEYIHSVERSLGRQHPVGMTFPYAAEESGTNADLFNSPAEWISPNPEGGYQFDPPPADGTKVILSDTDHLWGLGCEGGWVWKSFTRGLNPILMDPVRGFPGLDNHPVWGPINNPDYALWAAVRAELGATRRVAERLDLTRMTAQPDLASTRYCLADPGGGYVVYLPEGGEVTVDLSAATDPVSVEWIDPQTGAVVESGKAAVGGRRTFQAGRAGDAVLLLQPGHFT